jgi:hypothetical protein
MQFLKMMSPIPSVIHLKTGEGIPSVLLLLFVTKCIILHIIQYHVSRFEHQNIHLFFITTNNDKGYFQALAIFENNKSVI